MKMLSSILIMLVVASNAFCLSPVTVPEDYVRFDDAPNGAEVRLANMYPSQLFIWSDIDWWETAFPSTTSSSTNWHNQTIPFIPAEATAVNLVGLISISNGNPADVADIRISFRKPNTGERNWLWQTLVNANTGHGVRTFGCAEVPVVNRTFQWQWWKAVNYAYAGITPNWPQGPSYGVSVWCQGYYIPRHLNTLWYPNGYNNQ